MNVWKTFCALWVALVCFTACGAGGPAEITSQDGSVRVTAPAGWSSSQNFASISLSNNGSALNTSAENALPENAVLVIIVTTPYMGSTSTFEALNQTNSDNSEIIDFRAGENVASRLATQDESGDVMRIAVQVPDGRIFMMIAQASAGQLSQHTEALVSIASSLVVLTPPPTPTPSPFPTDTPEPTLGP